MTDSHQKIKPKSFAPLKNIAGFMELVDLVVHRAPELPGIGVLYGHSGLGKSYASIYAQNKTRAARVEIGESWNRKSFVSAILLELGVSSPRGSTADLVREAIATLAESGRPLIIDEADKLVDKGLIELAREIAEFSQQAVFLIGEEKLPQKLVQFERVHNRVLNWCGAQPCDLDDSRLLADLFLANASIDDSLLEHVRRRARMEGAAR